MAHTSCMLDKQGCTHAHSIAHAPGHPHTYVRTQARTHTRTNMYIYTYYYTYMAIKIRECVSMLRYTYIACLVSYSTAVKNLRDQTELMDYEAIIITHSECVCVLALFIQHAKCIFSAQLYVVIRGLSACTIFFHTVS
jgi:hypothetical protein